MAKGMGARTRETNLRRFTECAAVLSRAVAVGELEDVVALRIIKHELRRINVNGALSVPVRSRRAQEVIDDHTARGVAVPKNGSPDALHCDHLIPPTSADLGRLRPEDWATALPGLTAVVCVTAAENYRLQTFEKAGAKGWEKYQLAGVDLFDRQQHG